MNYIHFLPIELLPERYSAQWYEWFLDSFGRLGRAHTVHGDTKVRSVPQGQFLDAYETNAYKAGQLQSLCRSLERAPADEPATVFAMDGWFPGIESLAYIRCVARRPLYLCAIFHAGCYDTNDRLARAGCGPWGLQLEGAWLDLYDEVFVATNYHRELLLSQFGQRRAVITVTPFPVHRPKPREKQPLVVFPHRLVPEKQPEMFNAIETEYTRRWPEDVVGWVFTAAQQKGFADSTAFKAWYYRQLADAKVVVSTALQETYGIAMLEGVAAGAWPVAPNRLAYPETLGCNALYNSMHEAVGLIHKHLHAPGAPDWVMAPRDFDELVGLLP